LPGENEENAQQSPPGAATGPSADPDAAPPTDCRPSQVEEEQVQPELTPQ